VGHDRPEAAVTIDGLVARVSAYWPQADSGLLRRAWEFACRAHEGQRRITGEPFVQHPLEVAAILTDIESDPQSIAGALLHDVVEERPAVMVDDIKAEFGDVIGDLVDGVTKLTRIDFRSKQEEQAENLRKLFLATARDVRVIVIKLCDRLHNMRTLHAFDNDVEKQRGIATETLQIFAPLAHRLGVWKLKWELEDLSLRYLEPQAYRDLVRRVKKTREEREHESEQAIARLHARLAEAGIEADVHGRPKHFYSIYQKMLRDDVDFDHIHDLTALRVICRTVSDCYAALGVTHDMWMPMPDRFTDYIAKPKGNQYQSLHTKVMRRDGQRMEVQIRTRAMHRVNEYGVAAHWRYKEGRADPQADEQMAWLRQLLDLETEVKESHQFLDSLKIELFRDEVFVFTPNRDLIALPSGATPIDFAYRIHTEVGHRCAGARVNGRMVPLEYTFVNGDICEVITARSGKPSPDWLRMAQTTSAKQKIRRFLRQQHRTENIERGRQLLARDFERHVQRGGDDEISPEALGRIAEGLNYRGVDDLYAALGYGDVDPDTVVSRLLKSRVPLTLEAEAELLLPLDVPHEERRRGRVSAGGVDGFQTRLSKCCTPLPGDQIVGYVTRGHGLAIHRAHCKNLAYHARREPARVVTLDWADDPDAAYQTELQVDAVDRVGLLADITALVGACGVNIASASVHTDAPNRMASIHMTLDIRHRKDLELLIERVDALADVMHVRRPPPGGRG
ncbi:MAG: RelA/SpoT family protein, partial [Armatimonadota bacterium]